MGRLRAGYEITRQNNSASEAKYIAFCSDFATCPVPQPSKRPTALWRSSPRACKPASCGSISTRVHRVRSCRKRCNRDVWPRRYLSVIPELAQVTDKCLQHVWEICAVSDRVISSDGVTYVDASHTFSGSSYRLIWSDVSHLVA